MADSSLNMLASSASDSTGCKQGAFGLLVCPMQCKAHLEQTEGRCRESGLTLIHPLKTESPLVRQTTLSVCFWPLAAVQSPKRRPFDLEAYQTHTIQPPKRNRHSPVLGRERCCKYDLAEVIEITVSALPYSGKNSQQMISEGCSDGLFALRAP